jgi:hypothetical protein
VTSSACTTSALLHDRTAFEKWSDAGRKQHLLRPWLAAPVAPPLPRTYVERDGNLEVL